MPLPCLADDYARHAEPSRDTQGTLEPSLLDVSLRSSQGSDSWAGKGVGRGVGHNTGFVALQIMVRYKSSACFFSGATGKRTGDPQRSMHRGWMALQVEFGWAGQLVCSTSRGELEQ